MEKNGTLNKETQLTDNTDIKYSNANGQTSKL